MIFIFNTVKESVKKITLPTIIFFLLSGYAFANPQLNTCNNKIYILGSHLKIMLAKINIMPPIVQIYKPTRRLFDQAVNARRNGDYQTCIQKASLAIRYTSSYAR